MSVHKPRYVNYNKRARRRAPSSFAGLAVYLIRSPNFCYVRSPNKGVFKAT